MENQKAIEITEGELTELLEDALSCLSAIGRVVGSDRKRRERPENKV
jgi:hypothetical protein